MSDAPRPAVILVVEDDPRVRAVLAQVLGSLPGCRVETADDGPAGLAAAQAHAPDLILSDYAMPGMDGFALCRAVRAEPSLARAVFVILSAYGDTALKVQGLDLGVDDYLTKPVEAAELLAKVKAMLRLKELQDRLHADNLALGALRDAQARSFDQLLALLLHLLDLGLPGARERGARLAEAALRLAVRFEVPPEFERDLDLACRLHELGLAVNPELRTVPPEGTGIRDWRYALVTRSLLDDVDALRPVAEIVAAEHENWDGSGMPSRLQLGQIPLRSRFLRTLADFYALYDAGRGADGALAELERRSGTWYDPAVVAQWTELVRHAPGLAQAPARRRVPIAELEPGMVLAEDLTTNTGILLLKAGTRLAGSSIAIIRKRHLADPIVAGAWVDSAA